MRLLTGIVAFLLSCGQVFAATISITANTTVDDLVVDEDTVVDVTGTKVTYTVKKISGGDFKLVKTGNGILSIATGTGGSTFTGSLYVSNGVFKVSGNEPFGPVNAAGTSKVYIHSTEAIGYNANAGSIQFNGLTTAKPVEMIVSGAGGNQKQMTVAANVTNVFNGAVVWQHYRSPAVQSFMPGFGAFSRTVFAGGLTDENTTYLILGADATKVGSAAEIVFTNFPLRTSGTFTARWNTGWGSRVDANDMGGRVIFNVANNQVKTLGASSRYGLAGCVIVLDCDGEVFDPDPDYEQSVVGIGSYFYPTNTFIDVHGGDRRIGSLSDNAEVARFDRSGFANFGDRPGTVRVKQTARNTTVCLGCFDDVTFVKEGAKRITFTNTTWETSGDVVAAEGTLEFGPDSHFEFVRHVVVSNGATLKFTGGGTMNGAQRLTIADGGTLQIAGGKTETALTCEVNGSLLPPDTYTTYGGSLVVLSDTLIDGEAVFDVPSGTVTNDKTYGGEGTFVKRGAGTLVMTSQQGFTGALSVEAGTLEIDADTTWNGVTSVVVKAGAALVVRADEAFLEKNVSFAFETGATLRLEGDASVFAASVSLDGVTLAAGGSHTGTDNPEPGARLTTLAFLKGTGTLRFAFTPVVATSVTWTDDGADDSVWTPGNWSAAPSLRDGSAKATFASKGDQATVSNWPLFAGLVLAGTTDFTFAAGDGRPLRLGAEGIVTDPDTGANTSFTFAAPVDPLADQTWTLDRDVTLAGGLAGDAALGPVTVTRKGTGKLTLEGPSTYPGSFVVETTNTTATVATGTDPFGPASEGAAVTVKCKNTSTLMLKDAYVSKDLIMQCGSYGNGTLLTFDGTVELAGLYTHKYDMRLSLPAKLIFSGGVTSTTGMRFNTWSGTVVFTNKPVNVSYLRTMSGRELDARISVRLAVTGNSIAVIGQSDAKIRGGNDQPWEYAVLYTDVDRALDSDSMPVILGAGGHLDLNGHDQRIGALMTYCVASHPILPISVRNTADAAATLTVNQTVDYAQACVFEGPVNLVKRGASNIIVTNTWTSTGFVEVQAGALVLQDQGNWKTVSEFRLTGGTLQYAQADQIGGTVRPGIVFGKDAVDGCLPLPGLLRVGKTYYTDANGTRIPVPRGVYRAGDGSPIARFLAGAGTLRVMASDIAFGLIMIVN